MFAKDGSLHWIRDEAIMVNDEPRPAALEPRASSSDVTERKLGRAATRIDRPRPATARPVGTIPAATYIDT